MATRILKHGQDSNVPNSKHSSCQQSSRQALSSPFRTRRFEEDTDRIEDRHRWTSEHSNVPTALLIDNQSPRRLIINPLLNLAHNTCDAAANTRLELKATVTNGLDSIARGPNLRKSM